MKSCNQPLVSLKQSCVHTLRLWMGRNTSQEDETSTKLEVVGGGKPSGLFEAN